MLTVVTGAAGHIGGNLLRALLSEGRKVRVLVHQDRRAFEGLPVEEVEGDILCPETLEPLFEGADIVYHLAAAISIIGDPDGSVTRVNVEGTRNVVNACLKHKVKRLIHFSSIHALSGYPEDEQIEETRELALGEKNLAYDRSKAMGQMEVRAAVEKGLDAVVIHPTGVIGPLDFKPSRMGMVLLDIAHKNLPALVDGGYNWVDARDIVAGAMAAETKGRTGENYILSGHWGAFPRVVATRHRLHGKAGNKSHHPHAAGALRRSLRTGLCQAFQQASVVHPGIALRPAAP